MTPLVMVHGFMGGSDQWALQAPLAQKRDMICVDLPGFGRHADMDPIDTVKGFAEWVLDDLSRRGISEFDLLGHSMGGMVVQEMIRLAPEHVAKLILYGTGALGVLPGRFETVEHSMQRARADGADATARRIAATWFQEGKQSGEYEACADIAAKSSLPSILAGLEAMRSWSGRENLTKIDCKALILWGERDRTYPRAQVELLHSEIPNSILEVVPDCAHVVHLEQPHRFNRIVEDFLQQRDRD